MEPHKDVDGIQNELSSVAIHITTSCSCKVIKRDWNQLWGSARRPPFQQVSWRQCVPPPITGSLL